MRDINDLGYDIEKVVDLFYKDDEGALQKLCDDGGILGLVNQLSRFGTTNIFVESLGGKQDKILPEKLPSNSNKVRKLDIIQQNTIELDVGQDNESGNDGNESSKGSDNEDDSQSENDSDSNKDDEEVLVDVPFLSYNSDADDEAEEARDKVKKYGHLKK